MVVVVVFVIFVQGDMVSIVKVKVYLEGQSLGATAPSNLVLYLVSKDFISGRLR